MFKQQQNPEHISGMHRFRKICQRGSNFDNFFLPGEKGSKYHYRRADNDPSAKMAFFWCADVGPTLKAGIVAL